MSKLPFESLTFVGGYFGLHNCDGSLAVAYFDNLESIGDPDKHYESSGSEYYYSGSNPNWNGAPTYCEVSGDEEHMCINGNAGLKTISFSSLDSRPSSETKPSVSQLTPNQSHTEGLPVQLSLRVH